MSTHLVQERFPLELHWPTQDPFLFCAHHLDHYPVSLRQGELGLPAALLKGRTLGNDFEPRNGFRMYHGESIPGFPVHPHRGFETVTIAQRGWIDHADSLGASGRYGEGDVQWMTAGDGVQHSEMFPLLHRDRENTAELFQIWLNLPAKQKRVPADFKMLWSHEIPIVTLSKSKVKVRVICGPMNLPVSGLLPTPPVASWASQAQNETSIWQIELAPGATFTIPPTSSPEVLRSLYFYSGKETLLQGKRESARTGFFLKSTEELNLEAQGEVAQLLLLQSRSIREPVVQHGPFVMNTREEIYQAFRDFEKTQFGGWPWPMENMVHGEALEKFAKYPDGRMDRPTLRTS